MSAERWRLLRPALEELLELPQANHEACLATWASADPELAAELETLLALFGEARPHLLDEKVPPAFLEAETGALSGDLKGRRLGNYLLDSLIGEGGMGTVWTATRADGHFEGRVAVKLLNAAIRTPDAVHRFMREGRLLAKLSHPNIARLLDAGVSAEGMPFLVLEHVAGTAIDAWCDARRLDLRERVRLFLGVLAAIEHSHVHLVVHRDIKPTNVLVTDDGVPKLLDFGIAGLAEPDTSPQAAASARTRTLWGGRAMTLQFAAPEQLQGNAPTTRTDVYGLGVLLYLLLTGRHPTGLRDAAASAYVTPTIEGKLLRPGAALKYANVSPVERRLLAAARSTPPEKHSQELSGDLENILLKALKTEPTDRYASVADFAQDLRRFLEHRPVLACPDSLAYRAAKFVRRHRVATAASIVALLAITLAGALALRNAREARYEASRASAVNAFVREMFGVESTTFTDSATRRSTTVEQLLDEGTRKLQSGEWSPEARVDLLGTLADMYTALGQPAKAMPLLERRLELLRSLPAGSPLAGAPMVAETLLKISTAAARAGLAQRRDVALDEAESLVRDLRASKPALLGHWAYETATRRMAQDPDGAATVARESAAAFRAAGNMDEAVLALCQEAFALSRGSRYSQAQAVVREALQLARSMHEVGQDTMLHLLAIAADLDFDSMQLREAEASARAAQRAVLDAKGENHPMTSRAHMRVALVLWRRGDLAGCIREAQAGVAAVETSSGPDDRRVLPQALGILAPCLADYGRLDDAARVLERAARLWDPTASGGMHRGSAYRELMRVHVRRHDLARAEVARASMQTAMDAQAIRRKSRDIAIGTAELLLAQHREAEAVALLEPFAGSLTPSAPRDWDRVDLHIAWTRALTAADDVRAPAALRAAWEYLEATGLRAQAPLLAADLLSIEASQLQDVDPAAAAARRAAALELYAPRVAAASPVLAALRAESSAAPALTASRRVTPVARR